MGTKSYWQQLERQRISRRRLLASAGIGGAGLAVFAACNDKKSGTDGGPTQAASGTPRPGGRYKEATSVISDAVFGLDPHLAIAAGLAYFARMYNVLINRSAVNSDYYYYDLAADDGLETPDEQTYIFTIRPGVMIPENDLGVPSRAMDANDAYAAFERIGGIDSGTPLDLANACQFVCQYFARHEVVDPMTYRVETASPYAWFLYNIGRAISTIPPKELLTAENSAKMRTAGVGGGPFYIPQGAFVEGEKVAMEKNPLYYRSGQPYMDGWDVVIIGDRPALRATFTAEDSFQYGAASEAEVDDLTGKYDVYKASDDPTYTYVSFTMNVTQEPWTDPRIRKAAMYAINRDEYVERVYQGGARANGLVHWPVSGALSEEELAELQPFDPERSKQLIRDATGQDTVKIKMVFPNSPIEEHQDHLPIFLEQLRNAGFEVEQDAKDLAGWLNDYRSRTYQCSLALNQIYETAEIPLDFQHSKGPAGSDIYATGLQDPEIDAVIDGTKRITNFDEQVEAIKQAQRAIYEAGPACLPIVTPFSRTLYWNYVKDIPVGLGTTGLFLTQNIWLEK